MKSSKKISLKRGRKTFLFVAIFILMFAAAGTYLLFNSKAAQTCTTTLTAGSNVSTAIANAASGSTICLRGGNYSGFRIDAASTNKSNYVTVTSVDGETANFTSYLLFDNAKYIRLQNLKIDGGINFRPAGSFIEIKNNEITNGSGVILFGDNRPPAQSGSASCPCSIHDVNIEGNNIHDIQYDEANWGLGSGVGVGGYGDAYNVTVKNNTIKSAASDYIQSGMIHDWTVDGNTFLGPSLQFPNHPTDHQDLWQIFGCDVGCYDTNHLIYNITYTNNVARNTGTAESLLFQTAYFRNVRVENNLFDKDSRGTTVQIYNTDGLIYRNNTHIEEAATADGNQAAMFRDGGGTAGQNYQVDHNIFIKLQGLAGAISTENRAASWGTYDYNVSNDSSASGTNSIQNWTPNWVNTTDYEPVGLPYLAGYRKPSQTSTQTANLWIDQDGGTCTFSQQAVAYDSAKACGGNQQIQQALNSIGSGKGPTIVKIIAGQYPGQIIADDSRADADRVTFTESNGEVEFDYLDIHGDSITLNGFKTLRPYWTTDWNRGISIAGSSTPSKGVKLNDVIAQSGVYLTNSNGARITGGEICCTLADSSRDAKVLNTNGSGVVDTVIDGVTIHDAKRSDQSIHSECAFLMSPVNMTIKNSKFYNCTVYNVSLGRIGSDPDPSNVIFENNVFEPTDNIIPGDRGGYYNISLGHVNARYENLTFRNNSISSPIQFFDVTEPGTDTPTGAYSKTYFYSNMLELTNGRCTTPSQPAGQPFYDYNIVDINSSGCGSHQKVVTDTKTLWANYAQHDFRLLAKNSAGSPTNSTPTDILGTSRPQGSTPDAGAYEYTGSTGGACSTKQGDANNDNLVNILDISAILSAYGQSSSSSCADVNKDGSVNIQDLSLVLSKYGT